MRLLKQLVREALEEAERRPIRPPVFFAIPISTLSRIQNHPHANIFLPDLRGQWLRNRETGEETLYGYADAETFDRFTEGLRRMEPAAK